MDDLRHIKQKLMALGNPDKAKSSARFFKTAPGEYGEGDVFIGVTMPEQRKIAKQYLQLSLSDLEELLHSEEHEYRMTALIILVEQFKTGEEQKRRRIYDLYLENTEWINNWDLVDASAEHIVGPWLNDQPEKMKILRRLAKSKNIWERRIAMLATFHYIKQGEPAEALEIAELLVADTHDLIQKAVGWMLREIGKRCSLEVEEAFLEKHAASMPRTMLRYAVERFTPEKKRYYLDKR